MQKGYNRSSGLSNISGVEQGQVLAATAFWHEYNEYKFHEFPLARVIWAFIPAIRDSLWATFPIWNCIRHVAELLCYNGQWQAVRRRDGVVAAQEKAWWKQLIGGIGFYTGNWSRTAAGRWDNSGSKSDLTGFLLTGAEPGSRAQDLSGPEPAGLLFPDSGL